MTDLMQDLSIPLKIAAVRMLEDDPDGMEWTIQGFGMMRCYLDKAKIWRLNVYHSAFKVPGVSVIHTHPWHFDSWILGGELTNLRYSVASEKSFFQHSGTEGEAEYEFAEIITGIASPVGDAGAGGVRSQGTRWLIPHESAIYGPEAYYHMDASETHETLYFDGTVTLNRRVKVGDGEHANVYWPAGEKWVSAKPRFATREEIDMVRNCALELLYAPA